ncbi:MAG: glycosyltransferase family 9 protein, partial [Desulfovibrio sp.]|nr:glycosyltransferase family 9 protein [Desulfovibrio sp.]
LHSSHEHKILEKNIQVLAGSRSEHFNAVYNCNFFGITAALCRMFEPETVVGYRPAAGGIWRSPWARLAMQLTRQRVLSPLNLVDFWAHFSSDPLAASAVNPVAAPGGEGIGVVLAGRESRRSLPVPLLADVVRTAFTAMGGPRVRLLGSSAEKNAARRLLRLLPAKMQDRVEDLSGKTDWSGLVGAVKGLDALITPDTGTMHLAAHLGVPVLAFFMSSALAHETGPYGQGHLVWQAERHCAPCLESSPCPHNTACLGPFRSQELLRSLTLALTEGTKRVNLPDGLQLWRSQTDALGTVLRLEAGTDMHAAKRTQVREFLVSYCKVPLQESMNSAASVVSDTGSDNIDSAWLFDAWLCRDVDWMLPPGRYC